MTRAQLLLILAVPVIALGFPSSAESAKDDNLFGISYYISEPTKELRDYLNQTSFTGFGLDGRYFAAPQVSIGTTLSWITFREDQSPSGDEETVERLVRSIPIAMTCFYYWRDEFTLRPYLGGGLGAYSIKQQVSGGSVSERQRWHFGVVPEFGFLYPFNTGRNQLVANVKYNYALSSENSIDFTYFQFGIGIMVRSR